MCMSRGFCPEYSIDHRMKILPDSVIIVTERYLRLIVLINLDMGCNSVYSSMHGFGMRDFHNLAAYV